MENSLLKIKAMYDSFGRGEKKIADWILAHPDELISLSISELAASCGCGDATVVRFSKRLGFNGYQALKISVAQDLRTNPIGNLSFASDDSILEVYTKHIADIALTLQKTKSSLNQEAFKAAAEALLHAKSISIFGLGSSAPVAMDAMHKFVRAGLPACSYSDNHMQMIVASHLTPKDVVLAISHSGSSVDIVKALEQAKKNGALTITITNHGRSPIVKYSDFCLYTNADETKYTILAMTSRIAQLAIIDTLYTYIVLNGGEKITSAIQHTETALETKKY